MITAIYIHIPYCQSKCPYCDFASGPADAGTWDYLHALAREAAEVSEKISRTETMYIGGGTPSILTARQIRWLLERLLKTFGGPPPSEITFEANPCSLTLDKATAAAAGGVNRVSLGAQSFVDAELSFLGRRHRAADISESFSLLREAGINNISLDLIYAIPNQSVESWRFSLAKAIELRPEHLSTYCLTFEQGTPFWRRLEIGEIEKKSDEQEMELYETAREMLIGAGYEHYEISNFALAGRRSIHNTVYWSNEEYLGLGASAVSYISGKRITNVREPKSYIAAVQEEGAAACDIETIPARMQAVETAIQRLRLREGINCSTFSSRFGLHPKEVFGDSLGELIELGLIEQTENEIKSSIRGWHLADEVALKILP